MNVSLLFLPKPVNSGSSYYVISGMLGKKVASRVNDDGTMSSRPLEDMYPFLDRDEYRSNLYVDEV